MRKILGRPQNRGAQGKGKLLGLILVPDSSPLFPRVLSEALKEKRSCRATCKPEKDYRTPSRA